MLRIRNHVDRIAVPDFFAEGAARSGMTQLALVEGGVITAIQPTGPILGVLPEASFTVKEVLLGAHELLFIYTDGATDALNSADQFFGKERLLKALDGNVAAPNLLLVNIEAQLRQFIGAAEQYDDITMLALRKG